MSFHTILTDMSILETFKNATILVTGSTGFVGKAFVERIIRLTEVKKIYCLIRESKKGGKPEQRLRKEIIDSKIWEPLKEQLGVKEWQKRIDRIEAIHGDLLDPKGVFNSTDSGQYERIKQECQIIIHCAATIAFNEPLQVAVQLNVLGTLSLLESARTFPKLKCFQYVSTCYANSNIPSGSSVLEKVYPMRLPGNEDHYKFCQRVAKLPIKDTRHADLHEQMGFPNTYTFSKRLCEILISERHGEIPVSIVRPSVIGAHLKDPIKGWIDSASGAGAVFIMSGLGVISVLVGSKEVLGDSIPNEYVINVMLYGITEASEGKKGFFRVYHAATGTLNPITWHDSIQHSLSYWQTHPPKRAIGKAELRLYDAKWFNRKLFMNFDWIRKTMGLLVNVSHNESLHKMYKDLTTLKEKHIFVNEFFRHFACNEWKFECHNVLNAWKRLPSDEYKLFKYDIHKIDWANYFQWFNHGLHKYVLQEHDVEPPNTINILDKDERSSQAMLPYRFINDFGFSYHGKIDFRNSKSNAEMKVNVLQTRLVQDAIKAEMKEQKLSEMQVRKRAIDIMDQMFADPSIRNVRTLSYMLRKVWKMMYKAIIIDDDEISRLRKVASNPKYGPLVLLPTHRSYIDFLILSFVFFVFDLPIPHIAAGEDFLGMWGIRDLFRKSGAFFLRRSFQKDDLYKSIFRSYVTELLRDGVPIEFFVEGTRSRWGKTLQPKMGLLNIVCDAFLQKKVDNLTFCPINISYEKLLERESYSYELIGQKKTPETLANLLKNISTVLSKDYGTISVRFGKPINLKKYLKQEQDKSKKPFFPESNDDHKREFVHQLAMQITKEIDQGALIMPTALLGTLCLRYRDGVSFFQLKKKMVWLKDELEKRNARVLWRKNESVSQVIERSLKYMTSVIHRHRNIVEPNLKKKLGGYDYTKLLELGIAKNQLSYVFVDEALIALAIHACKDNPTVPRVIEEADFLRSLLQVEFIFYKGLSSQDLIETMVGRGIIEKKGQVLCVKDEEMYNFLSFILYPVIDTYWVSVLTIITLYSANVNHTSDSLGILNRTLHTRIQWFIEKFFSSKKIHFYESCSLDTIKNTTTALCKMNVVKSVKKESSLYYELVPPYTSVAKITNLADRIESFRMMHVVSPENATLLMAKL